MKLFLMRHAEAQQKPDIDDFLRPLTIKGIRQAEKTAQFFQAHQIDRILASPARRTARTAEIIQDKIKCNRRELLPQLYGCTPETIVEIISAQEDCDKTILIIAHNPGIFQAALKFMDPDSREYESLIENGMPPAKIIALDFPEVSSWHDLPVFL